MKAFIKTPRFSKDIYQEMRPRACNLLTLLQMEERC